MASSPLSPPPVPQPAPPLPPSSRSDGPAYLVEAGLSGIVFELITTGQVPIADATVYCAPCGERGHTWKTTDADGSYSFSGNVAQGGGIWVNSNRVIRLWVSKDGYTSREPTVSINGDARLDVALVRR
jgi:hypothetical protein